VTKEKGLLARKLTAEETGAEQLRSKRHQLIVKARVEQVLLPIVGGGTTADVDPQALSQAAGASQDFSQSGDVSATAATSGFSQSASRAVQADQELTANIDFSELPDRYTSIDDKDEYSRVEADVMEKLRGLAAEIERMQPNMKATEQFKDIETRLQDTVENLEAARQEGKDAVEAYEEVKQQRHERFMAMFKHVSKSIDGIYKQLTRSKKHPTGGNAYLTLDRQDEPYLDGIKYNAMPPMKRFRDMEQLSGGEKTVAALAMLFAIHSFHPSPFFVMDEIDAALDNVNVNKVCQYIRRRSSDFQCIVISLKDSFYDKANGIVGVYRDNERNCSSSLSLDLDQYAEN
jgi:structural maintenance of chromosome 1